MNLLLEARDRDPPSLHALGDDGPNGVEVAQPSAGVEHGTAERRGREPVDEYRRGQPPAALDHYAAGVDALGCCRDQQMDVRAAGRAAEPVCDRGGRAAEHRVRPRPKQRRP